jgi:hypothetical protein
MKRSEDTIPSFLTSQPDESEGLASRPGRFTPGKQPPIPVSIGTEDKGGRQRRSPCYRAEKVFRPFRERNPDSPVAQPVA